MDSISNSITAPQSIWATVQSNGSSVYLHVLLTRVNPAVRSTTDMRISKMNNDIIDKKALSHGEALYGVVGLIKYDKVPRYYQHRYLLSDFGWAEVSPIEGKTWMILFFQLCILHISYLFLDGYISTSYIYTYIHTYIHTYTHT